MQYMDATTLAVFVYLMLCARIFYINHRNTVLWLETDETVTACICVKSFLVVQNAVISSVTPIIYLFRPQLLVNFFKPVKINFENDK